jgi:hypothetical protein
MAGRDRSLDLKYRRNGHRTIRKAYQQRMDEGKVYRCWRCRRVLDPNAWDLGHDDNDPNLYRGPECRPCNRAAGARKGNATRARPSQPRPPRRMDL